MKMPKLRFMEATWIPAVVSLVGTAIFLVTAWLAVMLRNNSPTPREPLSAAPSSQVLQQPLRLADSLAGIEVVSASGQLFWIDTRGQSIYGYDLDTQKEFLVSAGRSGALTSDGKEITWLEGPEGPDSHTLNVQRYNPSTRQVRRIATIQLPEFLTYPLEDFPPFAADTDMVYYIAIVPSKSIHVIDIATGNDRTIPGTEGFEPVREGLMAGGGSLVWPEVTYYPPGPDPYKLPRTKLHAWKPDGTDTVLFDGDGCVDGAAVSGSKVVWTLGCQIATGSVYLTELQDGQTRALAPSVGGYHEPLISGDLVVWESTPEGLGVTKWSLVAYDITRGETTTLITYNDKLFARAIVDQNTIAYVTWCGCDSGNYLNLITLK